MVSATESSNDLDRLRGSLADYVAEASRETWKAENRLGGALHGVDELLVTGLAVYYRLRELDAQWSAVVRAGLVPFDVAAAKQIEGLYRQWGKASESIVNVLAAQGAAARVENAGAFRAAVEECPRLDVEGTLKALESERAGRMTARHEAMNELRRRILARGH